MKIRFWGVRGSIPSPGPKTARYGGNTTCIEVRSDAGELIIIDAGTGIAALSQALLGKLPVKANIFITHTHWDHIHGLPFFLPFFIPGNKVKLHGAFDIITGHGVQQVMEVQMQYSYFPIREAELRAAIEYQTLEIGETVTVGDATVSSTLLNHPVVDFGYRVSCNGKSMFFTGDHEPWYNIYDLGDEGYDEFQAMIDEKQKCMDDFLRGVDVLIVDCSYTTAEYPAKRGWGHGTFAGAIELARRVGAKQLVCTHHEPTRSDDELERVFDEVLQQYPPQPGDSKIMLSYEGLEIDL
ncbi:MBL fold metallo-hydrolase [Georgfuchsia toluolica]|uniref:MBL fold metallo-hydrolase n=1 Tax=Georgfuchsia toluolica TaxID=424218 RepID=A0A916J216_9PROT|nr:MBL fold metallo-hydrolase [Georgfuchsia toluolica]CAG4882554.1 MBL fold metallo-hydrolase [Georgfuchsia toluolica]